ncbi:acetylcholine receptor subunit alpha-like isoform X1 [Artemia franciscana]|uniref:Uncharacterized protein n=1 Tax=Artemia franciscana TaxID=6661 RepID=A0AA88HGG7_ARTSF|nr:hypothetical protein QYM36_017106 [Artemia franciscana]
MKKCVVITVGFVFCQFCIANAGNPDAKRLYDDLLSNYNKLVRPVENTTSKLKVFIKLRLSQLIDVNLKNQIMTTNLWVEQFWYDYKLRWDPAEYGGVTMLHVPSDHIWRPDIALYNNADGNFEVVLATKATIRESGLVEWKPPAIYKSACEINIEYFPFDEQTCVMKFGTWTYDGNQVDLRHLDETNGTDTVQIGMDLSEFYMSVEWDILAVPAKRSEKFYTCCDEPYLDITFNITMRRKTLFYTVNLIIPCMGISFLTVLTFYLPSDSGEKVTLSISILISLHVFFLLVVEIIPPTSLVVPLLGKYLIFAMILVSISICVTVVVLNVHFRSPQTHKMAPWVRRVFIHILPRLLNMKRPQCNIDRHRLIKVNGTQQRNTVVVRTCNGSEIRNIGGLNGSPKQFTETIPDGIRTPIELRKAPREVKAFHDEIPRQRNVRTVAGTPDGHFSPNCRIHGSSEVLSPLQVPLPVPPPARMPEGRPESPSEVRYVGYSPLCPGSANIPGGGKCNQELHQSCFCVRFIAEHTRLKEEATKVKEDWKYVAMVLDRLFLWIFTLAVLLGTAAIILQAPSLYDDRPSIDKKLSKVPLSKNVQRHT